MSIMSAPRTSAAPPTPKAAVAPSTPVKTYGLDPSIYRFSVAQYERMAEIGILGPDDKVELLEGYVVLKMARNSPHDSTIQRVQGLLYRRLPPGWDVRTQLAVKLTDSVPEPDFAIVRGDYSRYATSHPTPADIGLVIEVADTSLDRDLMEKPQVYARSNIVTYWVIDVANGVVHIFTQPSGPTTTPAYASHVEVRPSDVVPLTLDGVVVGPIPAVDLLP